MLQTSPRFLPEVPIKKLREEEMQLIMIITTSRGAAAHRAQALKKVLINTLIVLGSVRSNMTFQFNISSGDRSNQNKLRHSSTYNVLMLG